jgi:uncharacterized protein
MTLTLFSAFLAGLLGSLHCLGMCGGIVAALSVNLPQRPWSYLLAYNLGRLSSYVIAGAVAGVIGAQFYQFLAPQRAATAALWIPAIFMFVLGLYIGGWWQFLGWLEKGGAYLWRRIEPLGRHLLPVRSPWQALALGLLWGWLPCGLVYSILVFALSAGSAAHGALLMLAFGLGTLPMLFSMGAAAHWLNQMAKDPHVRRIAGALIMVMALFMVFGPHQANAAIP